MPMSTAQRAAGLDVGSAPVGIRAATAAQSARPAVLPLRGQPVAPAGPPATGAEAAGETAGGGRASARTPAALVRAYLARTASAPAQVSVQAAEGGISLVARADRLSREERDRLRVEIVELLARHGFAIADMTLNGEAWPLPQGRKY
jgi:hypothetical protein